MGHEVSSVFGLFAFALAHIIRCCDFPIGRYHGSSKDWYVYYTAPGMGVQIVQDLRIYGFTLTYTSSINPKYGTIETCLADGYSNELETW